MLIYLDTRYKYNAYTKNNNQVALVLSRCLFRFSIPTWNIIEGDKPNLQLKKNTLLLVVRCVLHSSLPT